MSETFYENTKTKCWENLFFSLVELFLFNHNFDLCFIIFGGFTRGAWQKSENANTKYTS